MMNYLWAGMIILSLLSGLLTGAPREFSSSVMDGAKEATELLISVVGIICFWSGMMEIAKRSGITDYLAKLFSPVMRLLFPAVDRDSDAMRYMTLNISANLLGLGNAATPLGIEAMKALRKESPLEDTATDDMVLFVVLNTASLQLLPTTLGAYRANYGSKSPFDIMPAVWVSSIAALVAGVTVAKTFCMFKRRIPSHQRKLKKHGRYEAWS